MEKRRRFSVSAFGYTRCFSESLVGHHLLDGLTGGLQVLTGVEVVGVLGEVLPDAGGHGQAQIGVDVDLADG